jgi:hypothetical protein
MTLLGAWARPRGALEISCAPVAQVGLAVTAPTIRAAVDISMATDSAQETVRA